MKPTLTARCLAEAESVVRIERAHRAWHKEQGGSMCFSDGPRRDYMSLVRRLTERAEKYGRTK